MLVAVAALLGAAMTAQAPAIPAEAAALLSKAEALYGDGAAHAAAFTQIYTPAGFETSRRESGTIWIQAPQRLRFDYEAPEAKIYTYDSGEGRFFSPEDRQLMTRRLTAEEKARLPIVFVEKPEELARLYEISLEPARGVRLKPRAADSELAWLELGFTATGSLEALRFEDSSGNRTEFRFEGWRVEKPRPAADYRITGPKGTRVVEP